MKADDDNGKACSGAVRRHWGVIGPDRTGGSGHVTFYVEVDDPTAYVARAEKLAGKTVVPPTDVPELA